MKRFLVIIGAALMTISISTASIAGSLGIGITGNYTMLDTSGSETQRQTRTVASGSISEDVVLPEFFVEFVELLSLLNLLSVVSLVKLLNLLNLNISGHLGRSRQVP